MEQQAPQVKPGGGTSDVTVMVVLFVVITIGLIAGFYFFLYKPKVEAINQMKAQRQSKVSQLNGYIKEVKDLMNYQDQLQILTDKWEKNKHFYVLGQPDKDVKPEEYQFEIFKAYDAIFQMGAYAGVEILSLKLSESFKYYMHDKPWDLPPQLLKYEWEPVFATRPTEGGVEAAGQTGGAMITPHTFTAVMRGNYQSIRRFIEVVQNMEGDYQTIISIHCYHISKEPSYYFSTVRYRAGAGRPSSVLYDVSVEVEMLMTFYELNEKGTPSGVPDVPGSVPCSFGGGGGGGSRGGGGPSPGARGGGTMSMG